MEIMWPKSSSIVRLVRDYFLIMLNSPFGYFILQNTGLFKIKGLVSSHLMKSLQTAEQTPVFFELQSCLQMMQAYITDHRVFFSYQRGKPHNYLLSHSATTVQSYIL